MRTRDWSAVVKKELSQKARFPVDQSMDVPPVTYDHELRVVTKRTKLWIQVAEMNFLHGVAVSARDGVRSLVTKEK